MNYFIFTIAIISLISVSGFSPIRHNSNSNVLMMGFFDQLFGGGKKATASHILIKGPKAVQECEQLKNTIYKSAIGRGNPEDGVQAEKLMQAVSLGA
jgi:hypothetical protein